MSPRPSSMFGVSLMALGGRYRTMFDLQAQRFAAGLPDDDADESVTYDVLS